MSGKAIFKNAAGAALMLFTVCSVTTESAALQIDPRCARFSDKLGCTCALQNGGRIVYGTRTRWVSAGDTRGGRPTNQAFTQCIVNNGGR
jgi:hypothetical protein